ncbi:MAG: FxsA family protein [Verrucomicrobia bacterium]|nr:FxsA family protein [Verrucomicrobiota bacterium]
MFGRLLILFITLPLVELYLLIWVSTRIHWTNTLMLVILTGAWGAYLAKSQGYSILARIQAETAAGRVPAAELIDGLLVLIGGIVLLTPGLLTDLAGFALMMPSFRALIRERVKKKFAAQVGHFQMPTPGGMGARPQAPPTRPKDDDVIDV